MLNLSPNLKWAFIAIFGILVLATVILPILKKFLQSSNYKELKQRIRSWWIMVSVFVGALLFSRNFSLLFFAFISFLATKEFFSMIETRRADRRVLFWAYLSIPIQYFFIAAGWYGMFVLFIPMYVYLFLPMRMILLGETSGFIRSIGTIHWCLMKTVFCLSHNAALLVLPAAINPNGGGPALVLFLVALTQLNDVFQYIWGRLLGNRKILPLVSPGKTWAGFLGGVATTTAVAFLIAPYLTSFNTKFSILAGLIIGVGGFVGDVVISAVKRDVGVKDSGSLIPGHGGILDRIDSLTYTAPIFFHFVYFLYTSRIRF